MNCLTLENGLASNLFIFKLSPVSGAFILFLLIVLELFVLKWIGALSL